MHARCLDKLDMTGWRVAFCGTFFSIVLGHFNHPRLLLS
jgi:hypothetical protein